MLLKENGAYHPVVGLMPSPLREVPEELGWYYEKWATPYMAAVARVVFRRKPDVTLTPQVGAEKIIEGAGRYVALPLGPMIGLPDPKFYPRPDVTITPQPVEERITDLGAAPEFGEWFKKNRILVVVVIVALVLLFFFLKKGRR